MENNQDTSRLSGRNSRKQILLPLIIALSISFGYFLGKKNGQVAYSGKEFNFSKKSNKLNEIINYIENEYVDSVDRKLLEEVAIQSLLQELDPHSFYISPEELAAMNEPLEGNFDGIGIEFRIQKDTITVINTIVGGPSELIGLKAGDRIIEVNKENVTGKEISNNKVMKLLRGEKGSKVEVGVVRKDQSKPLYFLITRDKIPIYSPYSYVWENGATTNTITGLAGGTSYALTVTDGNSCSSVFSSYVTGVENIFLAQNIRIYPNPVSGGVLTISNEKQIQSVKIYNVLGEVVYNEANKTNIVTIQTSSFINGVYFVNIETAEGNITKKIMIL
jgi:hypothetical protein